MGLFQRKPKISGSICCFCGQPIPEDPVSLTAQWGEEGEMWQFWPAHRVCLVERMSDSAKEIGGPFFEDVAG
jgi:hypothetical protein